MSTSNIQHRRTHNLLLISKLLNQRDAPSPFTLVLDNLEQSGKPLVAELTRRAKASVHKNDLIRTTLIFSWQLCKTRIITVSFETLKRPRNTDVFVQGWGRQSSAWQKDVRNAVSDDISRSKHVAYSPEPEKSAHLRQRVLSCWMD